MHYSSFLQPLLHYHPRIYMVHHWEEQQGPSTAFVAVAPTTNPIQAIHRRHRHSVISTSKGFIAVHLYRLHYNILDTNAHLHLPKPYETILSACNNSQLYFTAQQYLYSSSYYGNFNRLLKLQAKYCVITLSAVDTMY